MRVFISTADASGDLHAGAVLAKLRERRPSVEAFGLGGAGLQAAGLAPLVPQSELAIAGGVEVLRSVPRILRAYRTLRRALRERQPDLAILVDSPALNLPLASVARRLGIPVLYYVAPQVWAWRFGRVRKLRRRVDRVCVIFPFEEPLLRKARVPATFVGHPLVDRFQDFSKKLEPERVARSLGLDLERPILGLLPGSRRNEVERNLPPMLETAELLRGAFPELQVILMRAPNLVGPETLGDRGTALPAHVSEVRGRTHEAMAISTCLLAAPGTVTVEAALLRTPIVVTHTLNRLSFEFARRVTRVASSCMLNLIAEAGVVPERLQQQARPVALASLLGRLLRNPRARDEMRARLSAATARLGGPGAAERVAEIAIGLAS